MGNIKEAFDKVKKETNLLKKDIEIIKQEQRELNNLLHEDRQRIIELCNIIERLSLRITKNSPQKEALDTSTDRQTIQTSSTHPSTHNYSFKGLNNQYLGISTGNEGVSTDRQTDRQTDKPAQKNTQNSPNPIEDAVKILDSLDNIKKEIRLKFKQLTEQELLVFSALYQIEEQEHTANYRVLAERLNLTESSIRDYIGRLIKKGIPVEKIKLNNKNIQLSISENLKKVATLSTILQLRDL